MYVLCTNAQLASLLTSLSAAAYVAAYVRHNTWQLRAKLNILTVGPYHKNNVISFRYVYSRYTRFACMLRNLIE